MGIITKYLCKKLDMFCGSYPWLRSDSLSEADYVRVIKTPATDNSYGQACRKQDYFSIPKTFSPLWRYSTEFISVSKKLLIKSPVFQSIKTIEGGEAGKLSKYQSDCRHFWNMLVALMPKVAKHLPNKANNEKLKILNVACGNGWDTDPLISYFGKVGFGETTENIDYLGIDIRPSKESPRDRPNVRFEWADATRFDDFPFLKGKFDIVVLRHPEVFPKYFSYISPTWVKIFRESIRHLSDDGIMLVTAYRCSEHVAAEKTLTSYGAKRIFAGINPFASNVSVHSSDFYRDEYVAVYTKGEVDKIKKRDAELRIICGQEAIDTKKGPIQVSNRKVTAKTAEGKEYMVTIENDGKELVYFEPGSVTVKRLMLDQDDDERAMQIASNGRDAFAITTYNDERPEDKPVFYSRLDWNRGWLRSNYIISNKYDPYKISTNRGFCIAGGDLLAKIEVQPSDESRYIYYQHIDKPNLHSIGKRMTVSVGLEKNLLRYGLYHLMKHFK